MGQSAEALPAHVTLWIIGEDWNAAPRLCSLSVWNVNVDTEVQPIGQKFTFFTQINTDTQVHSRLEHR